MRVIELPTLIRLNQYGWSKRRWRKQSAL